jgi:nicotinate-nucleotide adenylyltransferase
MGGRFDPPHIAHLIHARLVFEQFRLSRILFIPAFTPPHKKAQAAFKDRARMIELAIDADPAFELSLIEEEMNLSYTVDTLTKLGRKFKDAKFFLIMGGDEFDIFDTWRDPERIKELSEIIVLPRRNKGSKSSNGSSEGGIHFPDLPILEISSTSIRNRISQGKPVSMWVPEAVANYISQKNLYKEA